MGLACSPHPPRASPLFLPPAPRGPGNPGAARADAFLVRGALYLAAAQHVLAAHKDHFVPAGAANQHVPGVVVRLVVGSAAHEVVALAAVDPVLAAAALHLVVALAAGDLVPAPLSLERVPAAQAAEGIPAVHGEHRVVVGAAVHRVCHVGAGAVAAGAVDCL